jgi:two-component system, NarL family, sensor histidine kinase DegS
MATPDEKKDDPTTGDPFQNIQAELDETYRALKEVTLMLEQSRGEVSKLTQRNAAISAHLQQAQGQIDKISNQELKMAYDSALDAQQRLFVMRGQLDKLQSDQSHLERHKASLERLREMFGSSTASGTQKSDKGPLASVEMLVDAQEAERQRLSRQMHDGPAQALSNFILQTEIAMRLLDVDASQARNELGNLKAAAMSTFQKVRNFIFELRPMMLDDLGLIPTIRRYADAFKEQTSMEINVTVTGNERRIEPYLEVMVFRAMQELLGNVSRQSQATLAKIQIDMGGHLIKMVVDDNGKGLDAENIESESGLGIKLIRERAEMLGGTFDVDSTPGRGTRIALTVPTKN